MEKFYTEHHTITVESGRHINIFVNKVTGLLIVDVIRPDEEAGNEILRINANAVYIPSSEEMQDDQT